MLIFPFRLFLRFWREYGALFDKLAEDPSDIRVVVLSSSLPKLFTAGLDCTSIFDFAKGSRN